MRKLIKGIIKFQNEVSDCQLKNFAELAAEQKPDALFIACSDSRIVPNLLALADPGDLFIVRNVGNIIPPADHNGDSVDDVSELAAIEFAVQNLKIKDIIICGHSECGAMKLLLENENIDHKKNHLFKWVKHAVSCKNILKQEREQKYSNLSDVNALSQINVLHQIDHLKTYSFVNESIKRGQLVLHAWWFDIASVSMYSYNKATDRFENLRDEN